MHTLSADKVKEINVKSLFPLFNSNFSKLARINDRRISCKKVLLTSAIFPMSSL